MNRSNILLKSTVALATAVGIQILPSLINNDQASLLQVAHAATVYDNITATKNVDYKATINASTRNDGLYAAPFNTSANSVKALDYSNNGYDGHSVQVTNEATTNRATFAKVVDGQYYYWIDKMALQPVGFDHITNQQNVNYTATINEAGRTDGVYTAGPFNTSETTAVANQNAVSLNGHTVTVSKEATTNKATFAYVTDASTSKSFWIDRAALKIKTGATTAATQANAKKKGTGTFSVSSSLNNLASSITSNNPQTVNTISNLTGTSSNSSTTVTPTTKAGILSQYGVSESQLPPISENRWPLIDGQKLSLSYYVDPSATLSTTSGSVSYATLVDNAVNQWNKQLSSVKAPINFVKVNDPSMATYKFLLGNNSTVVAGQALQGLSGRTTLYVDQNKHQFLSSYGVSTYLNTDAIAKAYTTGQAANVITHEIGHSLGLEHTSNQSDLMYTAPQNQSLRQLDAVAVLIAYTAKG